MPIYEYACNKCGNEFEREQKLSDSPVKTCPDCKSRKVVKLISRSSFVLKGGGWYADGYSDAKKDDSKGSETSKPADSGSTEKKGGDDKTKDSQSKDKSDKGGKDKKKGSKKTSKKTTT